MLLSFTLVCWMMACVGGDDLALDEKMGHELCALKAVNESRLRPQPPVLQGDDGALTALLNDTDVLHYDLDLEIVPSGTTLIGINIITVQSLADGVNKFPLQLHQNFAITSVQVNGVIATYTRLDSANLEVNLNPAFNTNDVFEVRVAYNGVPVSGGFGSINFSSQGGNPLIFTLSEPYYAHTWWPVKEDSNDKAMADMAFTVPNTLKVASNGVRQGIDVVAGNKLRYRWRTDYPTSPYLFSFSATAYNEFTDTWIHPEAPGGAMLMQFFIYPSSDTTSNRNAWLTTKQMLTTFSDLYGVYPFAAEKYGIYQFGFGGGMEHQTMTGQGSFGLSLSAHELGHQWWGDHVTCGAWGDIWLNEGFATYSEALWEEFKPGSSGTPALLAAMASRRPSSMDTVVYRYDTSTASAIFNSNAVYRKGAWVLHMLRHIVGDDAFFEILENYGQQHSYSTALTADFQAVAESVYGSSLATFFQQWVYLSGAPTYQTAWRNISVGGVNYVELYMKQTQTTDWPAFAMPVDIVTTTGGVNTTHKIFTNERAEHLLFAVSGPVTGIQVDPNNYILRSTNTTTTFVEGPVKVAATSPAPGSQMASVDVSAVQVVFHKAANVSPAHLLLSGLNTGTVPVTFSYDAGAKTVTLTPNAPLLPDTYTLIVSAGVTDVLTGLPLDGEVTDPNNPASLPSGDGLPGGSMFINFEIIPITCAGDVSTPPDGIVNVSDLLLVINSWGACAGCPADINGDNEVDVTDLLSVINAWGPCP